MKSSRGRQSLHGRKLIILVISIAGVGLREHYLRCGSCGTTKKKHITITASKPSDDKGYILVYFRCNNHKWLGSVEGDRKIEEEVWEKIVSEMERR